MIGHSLTLLLVLKTLQTAGKMDYKTLDLFDIDQIWAYYDGVKLCTEKQFAVAMKAGKIQENEHCEWKIPKDNKPFPKDAAEWGGGTIMDDNDNCIFACVKLGLNPLHEEHAERKIDNFINKKKLNSLEYDFYTYLYPCTACSDGTNLLDKIKFQKNYQGLYYSYLDPKQKSNPLPFAEQIWNGRLLRANVGKDVKYGLGAIKAVSTIDLNTVRSLCDKIIATSDDEKKNELRKIDTQERSLGRAVRACVKQNKKYGS